MKCKEYLNYIKGHPCFNCSINTGSDAHHISFFDKGMGIKVSDLQTIPLCRVCHTSAQSDKHFLPEEKVLRRVMMMYIEDYIMKGGILQND